MALTFYKALANDPEYVFNFFLYFELVEYRFDNENDRAREWNRITRIKKDESWH